MRVRPHRERLGRLPRVRDEDLMDIVGKVLVETIGDAGYRVDIAGGGQEGHAVTAVAYGGGERFVVRGADLYEAVVELAGQVGIELEDG